MKIKIYRRAWHYFNIRRQTLLQFVTPVLECTAKVLHFSNALLMIRGLSPPARYRLPTPGNRLRGSHSDRFAIRARYAMIAEIILPTNSNLVFA